MLWLSADIATKTGLALWSGDRLLMTALVVRVGQGPRYRFAPSGRAARIFSGEMGAWLAAFRAAAPLDQRPMALVCEGPAGGLGYTATVSLAERRGRVEAWWLASAPGREPMIRVDVNEWRRVARETWGASWPKDSDRCKALAVSLVREHYGRDVTEDEADAVLVGNWALRTRAMAGSWTSA